MVSGGDIFVSLVVGLAMPLALLDGLRALTSTEGPRHADDRGAIVWLLAVVAGPGLFMERMLAGWREGGLDLADAINAAVIAIGWATLYGFVVLGVGQRLL
jgi:Cu/Ag efflux pump CusA